MKKKFAEWLNHRLDLDKNLASAKEKCEKLESLNKRRDGELTVLRNQLRDSDENKKDELKFTMKKLSKEKKDVLNKLKKQRKEKKGLEKELEKLKSKLEFTYKVVFCNAKNESFVTKEVATFYDLLKLLFELVAFAVFKISFSKNSSVKLMGIFIRNIRIDAINLK